MRKLLYALLVLFTVGIPPVFAQDGDRQLDVLRIALQRARETTAKCENELADIWSQANELNKAHQKVVQEVEALKKQLEEKAGHERK